MTTFFAVLAPVAAIVGIVLGIVLNETLRKNNRREIYAPLVFEKRLRSYEGLVVLINEGSEIASQIVEDSDLTDEKRYDMIRMAIGPIAKYTDEHALYIDGDLGAHCTALFMGVEDIPKADGKERDELLSQFYKMRKEALRMIAEDSGVAEINKLFCTINRPKLDGPIIERISELRRLRNNPN